jgi:hypothetical protein
MFERTPISALLVRIHDIPETGQDPIQQNLLQILGHWCYYS